MISKRIGLCAALGLALGLGGCVDDYGYGGVQLGYGNGGYYGDRYDDGYGYGGYGSSYYGWYGDYYYPGTGIYVYDQYRRPYRWNDGQRRYWSNQQRYRGRDWNGSGSWNGFDRRDGDRWQGRGNDGNPQSQRGDGNGQWQRGDGNRQWQRGDGDRPGQRDRSGYVPNPAYRGNPGARADGSAVTPQQPRDPGRWQGRGGDRSGGQWQGRRGGGSAARRSADTRGQPAD